MLQENPHYSPRLLAYPDCMLPATSSLFEMQLLDIPRESIRVVSIQELSSKVQAIVAAISSVIKRYSNLWKEIYMVNEATEDIRLQMKDQMQQELIKIMKVSALAQASHKQEAFKRLNCKQVHEILQVHSNHRKIVQDNRQMINRIFKQAQKKAGPQNMKEKPGKSVQSSPTKPQLSPKKQTNQLQSDNRQLSVKLQMMEQKLNEKCAQLVAEQAKVKELLMKVQTMRDAASSARKSNELQKQTFDIVRVTTHKTKKRKGEEGAVKPEPREVEKLYVGPDGAIETIRVDSEDEDLELWRKVLMDRQGQ